MKKHTLYKLEQANGNYISGEEIASSLGVSRMAVSKAVRELRAEGAVIESSTKCGYKLIKTTSSLYAESVKAHLSSERCVYCYPVVESTNDTAKILLAEGAAHGTTLIAESQTKGRGRRGRSFFSPSDSGIYMSVIIKPTTDRGNDMYTIAAAVAARKVIAEYSPDAKIKWVNDIYVGGLKVAGILCEAVTELESGTLDAVICGIGINITAPEGDYPDDIKNKAGHISDSPIHKGKLAAKLAETLETVLAMSRDELIKEYSDNMMLTGKTVYYTRNGRQSMGLVLGVDSTGGLVVQVNDKCETLRSGEVQLEKF